jgi:hypothetical protein
MENAMFVYLKSEPGLWTVGHYGGNSKWVAESDHDSEKEAAARVHYLNGGADADLLAALRELVLRAEDADDQEYAGMQEKSPELQAAMTAARAAIAKATGGGGA